MVTLFSRLDPHVQRVSGWLTIGGAILSAIFTVLAKAAPLFQNLNWAGAVLVGIVLALGTMLALGIVLVIVGYGFRFFRPVPATPKEQSKVGLRLPTDNAKLKDEIGGLKHGLVEVTKVVNGIMESQTEMNGALGDKLKAVEQRAEAADAAAQAAKDYAEGAQAGLAHVLKELRQEVEARIATAMAMLGEVQTHAINEAKEIRERSDKMERFFETLERGFNNRLENIDMAFAALMNREWHQRLFRELEDAFEALAKPVDEGQGIEDGPEWLRGAKSWRGKLDQWLVIADYYAVGTAGRVLAQPEHIYDSDHWQFDEKALSAIQVHRFKELAIWWHNAKEAKPRVDSAFVKSAFVQPSTHGRVDSPPRMDGDL